jgi:3-oxoacyl-[acyl-carrier-protein] synthase II
MMPFAADRQGIVAGEGAVFFILETKSHALARGANVKAWLRGYASLADAHHPSAHEPNGRWEQLVMERAQSTAGLEATDIDILVAHATGTPKGDTVEIRAINRVFSDNNRILVTALKGHTGHTAAASGGMNILAGIHAMETGRLPCIAGTTKLDPEIDFDAVIRAPREVNPSIIQVNSFGFGGQNASVIISRDSAS